MIGLARAARAALALLLSASQAAAQAHSLAAAQAHSQVQHGASDASQSHDAKWSPLDGIAAFTNPSWSALYPPCNCACCITQSRGDGQRWGRKKDSKVLYGCGPVYFGQEQIHEGFATCESIVQKDGQYCERQKTDQLLASARDRQVDMTRFCFYECMPSFSKMEDVGIGGECIPATQEALQAADVLKAEDDGKNQPTIANGKKANNKLGGGVDMGANGNYGFKASFVQEPRGLRRAGIA